MSRRSLIRKHSKSKKGYWSSKLRSSRGKKRCKERSNSCKNKRNGSKKCWKRKKLKSREIKKCNCNWRKKRSWSCSKTDWKRSWSTNKTSWRKKLNWNSNNKLSLVKMLLKINWSKKPNWQLNKSKPNSNNFSKLRAKPKKKHKMRSKSCYNWKSKSWN